MDPGRLEVFSSLTEVTGHIQIEASHPNFTSLLFFKNLEVIRGRDKADNFSSLYIANTSLVTLHLRSLKRIQSGSVTIQGNQILCFAYQINRARIKSDQKAEVHIYKTRPVEECKKTGQVCNSQCSKNRNPKSAYHVPTSSLVQLACVNVLKPGKKMKDYPCYILLALIYFSWNFFPYHGLRYIFVSKANLHLWNSEMVLKNMPGEPPLMPCHLLKWTTCNPRAFAIGTKAHYFIGDIKFIYELIS